MDGQRTFIVSLDYRRSMFPKPTPETETSFPDGGLRAWSVVAGATLVSFATLGWINSFGVFQSYYEQNILRDRSASNIAWIGSIQVCLLRLPAFFTGWLLDRGYYNGPFAISSVLYIVSLFLVAECKKYWQFVLCQGVAVGIFSGMLFGSTPTVVSHWFHERRSFALGVFAVGSSIGGTVLPVATQQLLDRLGFQLSMRIMASILGFAILISNLLLRPRLPPSPVRRGMLNFSAFKNPAFGCCILAQNVICLGIFVPLPYLSLSAQVSSSGRSPPVIFYLISIANAASVIGRLSSGYLADRFGSLNVLIPFTCVTSISVYAWPLSTHSVARLIATTIVYGGTTGAFVALLASPLIRMGGMEDAGSRVGLATSCISFGAVGGPPLGGLVLAKSGGYADVGLYAGSAIMLGCMLLVITRRLALGKWRGNF